MKIDYLEIAEKATEVLQKIMSEKTGEELEQIFSLGADAFDKMKAAAMLAAGMVERIVTDLVEETDELPEAREMSMFNDLVIESVRELENV